MPIMLSASLALLTTLASAPEVQMLDHPAAGLRIAEVAMPPTNQEDLLAHAEQGDVRAMRSLATQLLKSHDRQDAQEAAWWFTQAVESGDHESMHQLASLYCIGWGVSRDYQAAYQLWKSAAQAGHADAMYDLAVCYQKAVGTYRHPGRSAMWFKRAAHANQPAAMAAWGCCRFDGWGTSRNDADAVMWWKRAAAKGQVDAMTGLAIAATTGRGMDRSSETAAKWWKRARRTWFASWHGHHQCQLRNGQRYPPRPC